MNKKGFTLIELLAVIVILAVVALITVPAVLNIIEDSRKGAAEASARNIISAAKTYHMQQSMKGSSIDNINLEEDTLKYDGDQASKGYIVFDANGKTTSKMYINGYCVEILENGKITSEKVEEDECKVEESIPTVTYTKYNDGDPIYFDPVQNAKCETPVIGKTGVNDTCMKWYAFLDSENSATVRLLLGHNTSSSVSWTTDTSINTALAANAVLATDITNWNAEVKATARLISATEVYNIAPTNPNWNIEVSYTSYYLHNGENEDEPLGGEYSGDVGTHPYAWLFDNTQSCTSYGCYADDEEAFGYWTSDGIDGVIAWGVFNNGTLSNTFASSSFTLGGVRPVIEVPKSIFE